MWRTTLHALRKRTTTITGQVCTLCRHNSKNSQRGPIEFGDTCYHRIKEGGGWLSLCRQVWPTPTHGWKSSAEWKQWGCKSGSSPPVSIPTSLCNTFGLAWWERDIRNGICVHAYVVWPTLILSGIPLFLLCGCQPFTANARLFQKQAVWIKSK